MTGDNIFSNNIPFNDFAKSEIIRTCSIITSLRLSILLFSSDILFCNPDFSLLRIDI